MFKTTDIIHYSDSDGIIKKLSKTSKIHSDNYNFVLNIPPDVMVQMWPILKNTDLDNQLFLKNIER